MASPVRPSTIAGKLFVSSTWPVYLLAVVLPPIAAYLLWDQHRALAVVSIIGIVVGLIPYISIPVSSGLIAYALTDDARISIGIALAVLVVFLGGIMLLGHFMDESEFDDSLPAPVTAEASPPKWPPAYCSSCGSKLEPNDRFCGACGWNIDTRQAAL